MLDVHQIRKDFPILHTEIYGKPLIYADNAATTQKPRQVLDSIEHLYTTSYSNVHRGVHYLSQKSTELYEGARKTVADFINARYSEEIVFVRGATEAVNLVANSYLHANLNQGDSILITEMEHHSNLVPWQMAAHLKGAKLRVIPLLQNGELDYSKVPSLLDESVKMVAMTHMSNSLGTINKVEEIIDQSHALNIPVLLDGAQSIAHLPIDIQKLDCDFFVFSGHKMYAPTGVGVLYAKREILEAMVPYQGGGDMILNVSFESTDYNDIPYRFEAGTPNIEGAVGLAAAIEYLTALGMENIDTYERDLCSYAYEKLQHVEGLTIIGNAQDRGSILSFILEGIHPHDVGTIMDMGGIAVRTGHHCTQPVMDCYNIPATTRISLAFYNTREEVDEIINAIKKVKELMG
jgi:cysteine desulfurase/selenocysteine lyase